MFPLAFIIGIYAFVIYILGITHLLYPILVGIVSMCTIIGAIVWYKKNPQQIRVSLPKSRIVLIMFGVLILQWSVNGMGVLVPEFAFDSLWYHLTIPKLFIQHHSIFFIEGGLYYYSLMPKLIDILYIPSLMFGNEIVAKAIHFSFGLLTLVALYRLSRLLLPQVYALLVLILFSSNLVVSWQATTAYIDLGRTFFEVMALYGIFLYRKEKKELWIVESAFMVGFAIATKLLALGTLAIFVGVLWYVLMGSVQQKLRAVLIYCLIALSVPLPFFIQSLMESGNPVYPFFSDLYPTRVSLQIISPLTVVQDFWKVFVIGEDPISPLYLMVLPLTVFVFKKIGTSEKIVLIYSLLSMIVWYITPRTGGGRFLLPYLPILSLAVVIVIFHLRGYLKQYVLILVGLLCSIALGYRIAATLDSISYLIGREKKEEFLIKHLNFEYGDFYDSGQSIQKIVGGQTVLVYGIHNMYYAEFPFIHESAAITGDKFTYILASSSSVLPERFTSWDPIYYDTVANVILYKKTNQPWVY